MRLVEEVIYTYQSPVHFYLLLRSHLLLLVLKSSLFLITKGFFLTFFKFGLQYPICFLMAFITVIPFAVSIFLLAFLRNDVWVLQIVEKLLRTAVADADVNVRKSIFVALYGNQCFDDYLAQADSLTAIFASLNDEVWICQLFD